MDDAGITPSETVCVMAGFVGDADECDQVAYQWAEAVKPIREFHGKEFFRRNPDGTMSGVYKDLSISTAVDCALGLVDVLTGAKPEPIGMAIAADVFRSLHEDERRWMTSATVYDKSWPMQGAPNHPWFACFHYCVTESNNYAPESERIYLTLDRQNQYQGNALKIYNELRNKGGKWGGRLGETLAFSSRGEAVLLQAADLLASVIPWLIKVGDINRVADPVAAHALSKLAINRKYVVAMDVHSMDAHLKVCPFRTTFWEGLSDPDLPEQIRSQGINVLAVKMREGSYATHHLRKDRVKIIHELEGRATTLGERNLTARREDSTKNT